MSIRSNLIDVLIVIQTTPWKVQKKLSKRVCGITSQKIRQMTSKYRQFASVISWVAKTWSIYRSMVVSQFPEKLRQINLFMSLFCFLTCAHFLLQDSCMKIYIYLNFFSPNSANTAKLVKLRKMPYFRYGILAFFAILPILSYLHFWDFPPRKNASFYYRHRKIHEK